MSKRASEHDLARQRILTALDEITAQLTHQAARLEETGTTAPILVTPVVARWVERIHWALIRYGEGEYAEAAHLADITAVDKELERWVKKEGE